MEPYDNDEQSDMYAIYQRCNKLDSKPTQQELEQICHDVVLEKETESRENIFTCITIGSSGVGKSTINNILFHGDNWSEDNQKFQSGQCEEEQLTKDIQTETSNLFGDKQNPEIKLIDIPGTNSMNEKYAEEYLSQVQNILVGKRIDAIIYCIKFDDLDRFTPTQKFNITFIQHLFDNIDKDSLYLCITRCDREMPSQKKILERINSYNEFAQKNNSESSIFFQEKNVIYFKKNQRSLELLERKIISGKLNQKQRFTKSFMQQSEKLNNAVRHQVEHQQDNKKEVKELRKKSQGFFGKIQNYFYMFLIWCWKNKDCILFTYQQIRKLHKKKLE